jgi:adenosine kinase
LIAEDGLDLKGMLKCGCDRDYRRRCYIYTDGNEVVIPVIPEDRIVDPTGVGDAFRGGFLAAYSHGLDWTLCGQVGSLAAVYVLEQNGTQNHHYSRQEFVERFRKHYDDGGRLDALLK